MEPDVIKLLEREAWIKAIAEEPDGDSAPALRKGFADVVKAVNVEERSVDTVISTSAIDRDGDIVNPKKWQLKHFKKNPVVQFAHDHSIPAIAQSPKIGLVNGKLATTDQFPPEDEHPFATMIFNLVKGKFIRAKSVGFRPDRDKFTYDEERRGFDFNGQELLEHSYVNVPANPEALVGAKSAGIDVTPLIKWAEQVLDDDGRLWLPRATVERALKIAEDERTIIPLNGFKLVPAKGDTPAQAIIEVELPDSNVSVEELEHRYNLDAETLETIRASVVEADFFTESFDADKEVELTLTCTRCEEEYTVKVPAGARTFSTDHQCAKEAPENTDATPEQLLTALLDSSDPVTPTDSLSDVELEFLGQALGKSIHQVVQESVRQRLTAMTGKLD